MLLSVFLFHFFLHLFYIFLLFYAHSFTSTLHSSFLHFLDSLRRPEKVSPIRNPWKTSWTCVAVTYRFLCSVYGVRQSYQSTHLKSEQIWESLLGLTVIQYMCVCVCGHFEKLLGLIDTTSQLCIDIGNSCQINIHRSGYEWLLCTDTRKDILRTLLSEEKQNSDE